MLPGIQFALPDVVESLRGAATDTDDDEVVLLNSCDPANLYGPSRPYGPLTAAGETFDAVLNMEVVEHVADPQAYLDACASLLRPGGIMVTSTINRNPKSFLVAIVGAEHIMRWLPRGTHEWSRFITPDELFAMLSAAGLEPVDRAGMVFNPFGWSWSLSERDLSVNYVTAAVKAE